MLIDVPPHFKGMDGKWEHHVRQSDIKSFRQCPELHRKKLMGEVDDYENDVAIIGTACHAGAEHYLSGKSEDYHTCLQVAAEVLTQLWNSGNLWQVSIASLVDAMSYVKLCFRAWWDEVRPIIDSQPIVAVEQRFDVLVYEDVWRRVYASGTSDLWLDDSIVDWKFSTKDYAGKDAWKHNRYDPQSTWYLWARDQIELDAMPAADRQHRFTIQHDSASELLDFTFCRIHREKGEVQWLTVEQRTVADCLSLLDEVLSLCKLIEAKVSAWPLGASDWWCSPVWCPAWNQCRGKHIGDDPWGLLERKRRDAGIVL